jgi:hypothetical protein
MALPTEGDLAGLQTFVALAAHVGLRDTVRVELARALGAADDTHCRVVASVPRGAFDTAVSGLQVVPAAGGNAAAISLVDVAQIGLLWETAQYAAGRIVLPIVAARDALQAVTDQHARDVTLAQAGGGPPLPQVP